MAAIQQNSVSLTLVVYKRSNRVVFAEANNDFVDILFSFLTLPIGTLIRILGKQSEQGKDDSLECMTNLYQSLENLDVGYFEHEAYKEMLLHTRNSSSAACNKLKVNIDDTRPTKYYLCNKISSCHSVPAGLSTIPNRQCACGGMVSTVLSYSDGSSSTQIGKDGGVFIQGLASFVISDDLKVMPMSSEATLGLLNNLDIASTEELETINIVVGFEEVLRLLKNSLCSKTSLTNTFLKPILIQRWPLFKEKSEFCSMVKTEASDDKSIKLILLVRKSSQKPIYAEVGDSFVSFLFGLLHVPFGAMLKLLGQGKFVGCMNNLYGSVERVSEYIMSEDHKAMLVSPRLAIRYGRQHQLLDIKQVIAPLYYNYSENYRCGYLSASPHFDYHPPHSSYSVNLKLLVPERLLKGPLTYMLTDDLVVTPLSSVSTIKLLERLKIPVNDIEKRTLSIGRKEVLQLLEASLTSNSVLGCLLNMEAV